MCMLALCCFECTVARGVDGGGEREIATEVIGGRCRAAGREEVRWRVSDRERADHGTVMSYAAIL